MIVFSVFLIPFKSLFIIIIIIIIFLIIIIIIIINQGTSRWVLFLL